MSSFENNEFQYILHKGFLNKSDCDDLIKEFVDFKTARTLNNNIGIDLQYRKSEIATYERESKLLKKIRKIFSEKTKTSIDQQETPVSFIRYEKGGEYKPHYDCFGDSKNIPNEESGDRLITGIFYLNDDYIGGETEFPLEKIKIKGNQGDLLVWNNLNENRVLNKKSLHAGLPIIDGVKYILVIWVREREINRIFKKNLL
jgi:prolyl 4-hydroxylase